MGTRRQKKLARLLVKNSQMDKEMNAGEMLEKVGYAKNTAEAKPGEIISSVGVQEELRVLGFTEQKAKEVVSEIMNDPEKEPNARLKAADMTFKVHGSYAPEKHDVVVERKLDPEEKARLDNLLYPNVKEGSLGEDS